MEPPSPAAFTQDHTVPVGKHTGTRAPNFRTGSSNAGSSQEQPDSRSAEQHTPSSVRVTPKPQYRIRTVGSVRTVRVERGPPLGAEQNPGCVP